jgi:hypothetical protein
VADPRDLSALRMDVLRRAVEIYLEHAYAGGETPEAVRRRLDWPDGVEPARLLAGPPFEKASKAGERGDVFALRLGNRRYPHMKLQIQPWPNAAGFLLSVNTHDQVLGLDPHAPDADAFRALQAENQKYKEGIEAAWDREGLPTFLRYLREYIASHPNQAAPEPPGDRAG